MHRIVTIEGYTPTANFAGHRKGKRKSARRGKKPVTKFGKASEKCRNAGKKPFTAAFGICMRNSLKK